LGSKVNFSLRSQQLDIVTKFAAGVVETGGKLPPVSTTLAKLVAKFTAGVIDTGGNFAARVNVLLIPVVNLDLGIYPRIF
jgi:hypothetical protein